MDTFVRSQTPEQLLRRTDAIAQDPSLATPEGRVIAEVRDTLGYLALGKTPRTVLGGLIVNRFSNFDTALIGGRPVGQIAAVAGIIDAYGPNERGDTIGDVLHDLIKVGLVEYDGPAPGSVGAVFASDKRGYNRFPYYKLSSKMPEAVEREVDAIKAFSETEHAREEAREKRKLQRQQAGGRRWFTKKHHA